jgi:uncharacterized membrane protein YoaK (UPF0700 family)
VIGLLMLTFVTGLIDAIRVLVLGHGGVANMTGNVIFLGFVFVPHSGVDLTAAAVAFAFFVLGAIIGGRFGRHLNHDLDLWITVALGAELLALSTLAVLAGTGVLGYHGTGRLILIAGLAMVFGAQNVIARRFGIPELSTTVITGTIAGIGSDSRLAGGRGDREKLRWAAVLTLCAGAVVGATLSRFVVAPVIGLAAVTVAAALAVFRFGPKPAEVA